jgi:hypothetical protein
LDADVLAHPNRKLGFGQAAFGESDHDDVLVLVAGDEVGTVEREEDAAANVRRALVAVDEGMVAGQSECETGGKVGQIRWRIAVGMRLLRARQRLIQQVVVAHAGAAAVFRQLSFVDGDGKRFFSIQMIMAVAYCASLCRTFRSLRMTSSATSICFAKVGS